MKNVNVLLAVVLCAGLCVLFGLFNRSADESLGWSPNDMYMQSILSSDGSSFTSANLSGGNVSNDGVAVSMRNGSFSLRTRTRHASSPSSLVANGAPAKSADFWGALSPNSPIANGVPGKSADFWGAFSPNSLIGHMTSSAEFHSFGGGSNMAMGSYTSSSNTLIASSPAIGSYSPSPSSPIALSPNTLITSSPNNLIAYSPSNGEIQVAAEQALMSASSSASGLFGGMMTSYGTASYEDVYGSSSNRRVKGSMRLPGSGGSGLDDGFSDTWLAWLGRNAGAYGSYNGEGGYGFDVYQLRSAYDAWLAAWLGETGLTEDKAPKFEDFLNWFYEGNFTYSWTDSNGNDQSTSLYWVPIGSALPLVIFVLLYVLFIAVRRRKLQGVNNVD